MEGRVRPGEPGGPGGARDAAGGVPRARPGSDGLTRAELRRRLTSARIAGDVATPRENNLLHYRRLAARRPYYMFGLDLANDWTFGEVFALMVKRCGVNPDPEHERGADTIDPDLTIDALEAMAGRLAEAVARRERVLLATGHPGGLMPVYLALARALKAGGCRVLTPAAGWSYVADTSNGPRPRHIRYIDGVAALSGGGGLHHTHDPDAMRAILETLPAGDWPDLAIADHGWAGAAGQAGVATIGFADCNDPGLFAGEAEGKIDVVVPLDDNVHPDLYAPLTVYLLTHSGLFD